MTTLTKSTGTVTLSGTAEKVTLPAAYGWVWLKNMSDSDMFAGLSADISEGADGVMVIPSGECGRIQTDGFNSIYLMGTGNALVVAQNYADCPFKVGGKGGESPDLSAYAKKTDVPNIKVNAAVNADTVGGHTIGCDVPENAVFTDTVPDLSAYAKTADVPNIKVNSAVDADTVGGKSVSYFYSVDNPPIKSTNVSGTTNESGDIYLWGVDTGNIPISACGSPDTVFSPFLNGDASIYMLHAISVYTDSPVANTAVTATVYYF